MSITAAKTGRSSISLAIFGGLGIIGFGAIGFQRCPSSRSDAASPLLLASMVLSGVSQIGSIVGSLGLLGECVLKQRDAEPAAAPENSDLSHEATMLLPNRKKPSYADWKGSIAGTLPILNLSIF